VPILDFYGSSQVRGYQTAATVWGPLGQQKIKLESVPDSSAQDIALLLGAGIDPEQRVAESKIGAEPPEKSEELPPPTVGCSWQVE
jgi:hypothetical protein